MARHAPADYFVDDEPTVYIHYGEDGSTEPDPDDPIPGWRKPIALAGWGVLIAVLIALIVWGIIQLIHGAPPQEPVTNPTPATATTTVPRPSSTASVAPPQSSAPPVTTPTDAPTASTEDTLPSTATTTATTPSGQTYPLPQLPSVITLPALPGLPTEITLPPGL
ncbi:MAG: oligopeptide transporter substrate-binding protein [Actinomycetota bacterium]|uniref:Oligopeptide transporter substrate-binding protein n=1 Tax=Mycobacterium lentiflavum TaxID=141349 RepID=A0ABY3UX59_MYCLN|nr:oligopeptide transporter substrate-binding protein [Mycobacterium lentiflavum]MEE3064242.1 oligopeptide transporter substrate-binding protein [Actinomycetota bacterium]ULP42976.1 oligopeptide transporter substrate-binding protein [Mycobacterium lentiflavum]